ncbi:MAG: tetratricopeptide repeat protein [Anaerolineae bacterium]|nr:tetratricopeptide repeat protein [Anaerolineae bacterium]
MTGHYFISYSTVEASDFAGLLYDTLVGGYPRIPAWLDKRCIQPQMDWEVELENAIADCGGLLYVMTRDSVHPESPCRLEVGRALTFKRPIIPLKLHADVMPPLRVQNRQYIDFTDGFEAGIASLRQHLAWLETPEGRVYILQCRLRDAERDLPRTVDASQKARLEAEVQRLTEEIEHKKSIAADPEAARQRTSESIERSLERERLPRQTSAPEVGLKIVNHPPRTAPNYFQDRHIETQQLGVWLGDPQTRLAVVIGRGGVGKTAMVCRLLEAVEKGHLPDEGARLHVDGIVYLSAVGTRRPDLPTLFADLSKLLPKETAQELDAVYRDVQASPAEKMQTLLSYFPPDKRVVVLLDNFEDYIDTQQSPPQIMDAELDKALSALLEAPAHGLKAIMTTRVAPKAMLDAVRPGAHRTLVLDQGLDSPFAENVLREMDATGKLGLRDAPDAVLALVRERTRGYPRALEALVTILEADPDTSLDEILSSTQSSLPDTIVEVMVGEAFKRLDSSAQQVLQALAIFRKPVPPVALDYVLQTFQLGIDSAPILARLANMHFVRRESGRYSLHEVDRKYALTRIAPGEDSDRFEAGDPVFTRIALHSLGANYLRSIRKPRSDWQSLADLQPQLDEIELRCEAGDWDTASEVLDTISNDYLQKWGYNQLEAEIRERFLGHLTDDWQRYLNQYELGRIYQVVGNIERAMPHLEQALALAQEQEQEREQCRVLAVMGYCHSYMGNEVRALAHYEQCMEIARKIGATDYERALFSVLGSTYKNLGRHEQALDYLERALTLAREAGDDKWEAISQHNLGSYLFDLGNYRAALEQLEAAYGLYREQRDYAGQFNTLGQLADIAYAFADMGRALDLHEQRIALAHAVDDVRGEGVALRDQAQYFLSVGQRDRALASYQQGVILAQRTGIPREECQALRRLGNCYTFLSQHTQAFETYRLAIQVAHRALDKREEALSLAELGLAKSRSGRIRDGMADYEQALALIRQTDDRVQEAALLVGLGDRAAELEDLDATIAYLEQALTIVREQSNDQQESLLLARLGYYLIDRGDVQRAITYYQRAIEIERRLKDRKNEAISLSNVAYSYLDLGQIAQAQKHYREALEIVRQTEDRYQECVILSRLATCYATLGEVDSAQELLESGLVIAQQIKDRVEESGILYGIARCHLIRGDVAKAVEGSEVALKLVQDLGADPRSVALGYQRFARMRLIVGDVAGAQAAIDVARGLNQPDVWGSHSLTAGIIALRLGDRDGARDAFQRTIATTEKRLARTPDLYDDQDTRATALCGLVLLGETELLPRAVEGFRRARQVASLPGAAALALSVFDALAVLDTDGLLAEARQAAAGV